MERIPVPTAPSERSKWQGQQPNKRIGWLVLTVLLSLGTGFSGGLLARLYQFELLSPNTPDLIVVPENSSSGSANTVRSLQEQQADALVLIEGAELLGMGVVLSGDGWIVTATNLNAVASVTVKTNDDHSYVSDQIVVDAVTGLSYIHVDQDRLRVAQFSNTPATLGENVIAYGRILAGDTTAFAAVAFTDADTVLLDRSLPANLIGAPIYDLDSSIIGFATDTTEVIPIEAVNEVAYGLFTSGEIIRD